MRREKKTYQRHKQKQKQPKFQFRQTIKTSQHNRILLSIIPLDYNECYIHVIACMGLYRLADNENNEVKQRLNEGSNASDRQQLKAVRKPRTFFQAQCQVKRKNAIMCGIIKNGHLYPIRF